MSSNMEQSNFFRFFLPADIPRVEAEIRSFISLFQWMIPELEKCGHVDGLRNNFYIQIKLNM